MTTTDAPAPVTAAPATAAPTPTRAPAESTRRRGAGFAAGVGGALLMVLSTSATWMRASTITGDGFTLSKLPSLDASKVSARYLLDRGALLEGGVSIANLLVILAAVSLLALLVARLRVLTLVSTAAIVLVAGGFVVRVSNDLDALRTKGAHTTLLGFIGAGVYLAVGGALLVSVAFVLLRDRRQPTG